MDHQIERKPNLVATQIANGQTASGPIKVEGMAQGTLFLPAALTGANFSVYASYDGVNFFGPLKQSDGITNVAFPVTANLPISLPGECFGQPFIQFVSDQAEGAARALTVSLAS